MSNRAIISFANNRGNYYKALDRLEASLKGRFDGTFIGYRGEASIGAPLHTDNPYAFKVYTFRAALAAGYEKILYLDSSVYAIADVKPVFDIIEQEHYLMQEAGHYLKDWTNDDTLRFYAYKREDLGDQIMYGNAGMLGLNFNSPLASYFFQQWEAGMKAGLFKGDWANHRHDMTVGSIIANRLNMKFKKGDEILQYGAPEEPLNNDTIIFKAQGV